MAQLGAMHALPDRLRKARDAKGLTTRDVCARLLDRKIKLSHVSITKYENGDSVPSVLTLEALALIYEKPASWFLDSGTPLAHAVFRNLPSRVTETKKRQYIADAHLWLEAYRKLEMRMPKARLKAKQPVPRDSSPQQLAKFVRKGLGINDDQGIPSLVAALEHFGVRTIEVPTDLAIDGLACRFGDEFAVVLNPTTHHDRARMNAAHELGHVLLGDCDTARLLEDADLEARAYEFASHLLLPQAQLARIFERRSLLTLLDAKRHFGISMQAMIYRASHGPEKLLDDRTAKWLWIQFAKRGWRKHEPGEVRPDRAMRFDRMLDAAIGSKAIRWSEVESLLGIGRDRLQQRIDAAIHYCLGGEQGGDAEDHVLRIG